MPDHLLGGRSVRSALLAGGVATAMCLLPAASGAATVTPTSFTSCSGKVSPDAKGKAQQEPNLLDYSFHCDSGITAYTIVVEQQGDPGGAIDDFLDSPTVFETDDTTPSPTETVTCEGVLPSNGINCNTGALGAQVSDGYYLAGTVDPVQAYCKHLPTGANGAKPRPGALAIPRAQVALIVTDYTGAESGPFTLPRSKPCGPVPNKVPTPKTTKTKR